MMFPFLLVAIDKCRYMERQESPQLKIILFSAQLQTSFASGMPSNAGLAKVPS